MILAHGDRVVQYLPTDYSGLISDLKNPNTTTKFIRCHPAHLPATTYALAFMKLHGLLMMEGLASVDYLAAYNILDQLPYQDGPHVWTKTAKKNRLLKIWLKHRHYDPTNPFHIMEFGRNVMGAIRWNKGEVLQHSCHMVLLLTLRRQLTSCFSIHIQIFCHNYLTWC